MGERQYFLLLTSFPSLGFFTPVLKRLITQETKNKLTVSQTVKCKRQLSSFKLQSYALIKIYHQLVLIGCKAQISIPLSLLTSLVLTKLLQSIA